MNLVELGIWIGIVAGCVGIIIAFIHLVKYIRHKIELHRPIHVCYLIPQASISYRQFEGAPAKQSKTTALVTGVGRYRIMNELTVDINVNANPFTISFEGSSKNKPIIEGPDNPFIVGYEENDGIKYRRDWHGNLQPFSPEKIYNSFWSNNEPRLTGHRIKTYGRWKGKMCFTIPIIGEKPYVVKLDFEASEEDQIPFLKINTESEKVSQP